MSNKSARAERQAKIEAASKNTKKGIHPAVIGTVIAVVAIVAIVAAVVINQSKKEDQIAAGGTAIPAGVAGMGSGIPVSKETSGIDVTPVKDAPTVDLYEDFQCPACGVLEKTFGEEITKLATDGKIKVNYHILTFLDDRLRNDSSERSALGATCAADQGKFDTFHNLVYANQPQEGVGYTNEILEGFAKEAGVADIDAWNTCVTNRDHAAYLESVTKDSNDKKVTSTPGIMVNGTLMDNAKLQDAKSFADFIGLES